MDKNRGRYCRFGEIGIFFSVVVWELPFTGLLISNAYLLLRANCKKRTVIERSYKCTQRSAYGETVLICCIPSNVTVVGQTQ